MSGTKIYHTKTSDETKEVAKKLAPELAHQTVLCLYGDLGAGKTTFMQGLIEGFGLSRRIVSPTFIIMRTYDIQGKGNDQVSITNDQVGADEKRSTKNTKRVETLYHADLYRLTGEKEVQGTGLLEALEDTNGIVAIEWPDRMGNLLPEKRIDVHISLGENENERTIVIADR